MKRQATVRRADDGGLYRGEVVGWGGKKKISGRAPSWLPQGRAGAGRGGCGPPSPPAAGRGRYGGRGGSGEPSGERGGGGWAAPAEDGSGLGPPPLRAPGPDPLPPLVPAKWRRSAGPPPPLYRHPPAPHWAAASLTSSTRPRPPRRGLIGRRHAQRDPPIGRPPRHSTPLSLPAPPALPPGASAHAAGGLAPSLAGAAIRCEGIGRRVT